MPTKTNKQKQLTKHIRKHKHKKDTPLYHLDPHGKVDTRKMIYASIPTHMETQAHGLIQYSAIKKRWECAKCAKWATINDKAGIIQHAIRTHQQTTATWNKYKKPTKIEQEHIQTRIHTLWEYGKVKQNKKRYQEEKNKKTKQNTQMNTVKHSGNE